MKWERGLNSLIDAVTDNTVDRCLRQLTDLVDCRQKEMQKLIYIL